MRRLILVVALVAATRASALDPARPLSLYLLDVWRDGLPQYTVQALAQTPDGCLWFGTFEGLVRFDGQQLEVFDPENTPALRSGRIRSLLTDRDGTLWIGTNGGGLVRYANGTFTSMPLAKSVSAIAQARDGSLWFGSEKGAHRLRRGRLTTIPSPHAVLAIAEDTQGGIWIGTEAGLLRFDGRNARPVALPVAGATITSILPARDGRIWIATQNDGLFRRDGAGTITSLSAEVPAVFIAALFEDRRHTIWIGASPGGLIRVRGNRYETLTKEKGLPNNSVRAILEDREGNAWVGTNGGLARLSDRKFITYTARNGLTDDNTRVVLESPDGGLWIGTYGGGVNRVDGDGVTRVFGPEQGVDAFIRTMALDASGALWAGTSQGLARIAGDSVRVFGKSEGLSSDRVDALAILRDGTLLASGTSLQALRDGRFAPYLPGAPPLRDVRAIFEDARGTLWLGTADGVVEVRDRRIARTWTTADGLPGNTIFAFHEDRNGDLWIGTHDGLARLRGGEIAAITSREGLPWNVVFQILDDGRGHFWLTSNRGMARVDRASIDAFLDHGHGSVRAVAFGKKDGMGSDQCNGATQPAGIRLRDGRLAIPTVAGLTIVDPANLHINRVPPSIVLQQVVTEKKTLDLRADNILPSSTKRFEFHYAGVSLLAPELVHYRFRIDDFDPNWIDAGTRRVAVYTSLPPGRHVFHVAAINNDGVWSAGNASFTFEITPPLWQRWWAIVLYVLGAVAAVALAIRIRERASRRRTELLEARVHERTLELERAEARAVEASRAKSVFLANMSHELRTPLNAVIGIAQLIARSGTLSPRDRENVGVIRRSGEHLLSLINDVLSMSKIESGTLALHARPFDPRAMIDSIVSMMRTRAEESGLDLYVEFDPANNFPPLVLGDEGKLRQILLNLLGNAVKFTREGSIALRASWAGNRATFEVRDTGPGIEPSELPALFAPFVQAGAGRAAKEGTGLGLAITRQLVELMKGEIHVTSDVGRGTDVRFEIELPQSDDETAGARRAPVKRLAPDSPQPRIAVVDDSAENRLSLASLLRLVGFEVREAANGREAVELWASWKPDLIFMDQRMPEMDGSTATRAIRTRERITEHRTKIVALTASVFEHERDSVLASGADDFVLKPFDENTIFDVLAKHLGVTYIREGERRATGRILVVDDSSLNRQFVGAALANLGFAVTEATNGIEALELLGREDGSFDAVLLDIEMPELDGRETVKRIRADARLCELPVIALTAHDADEISRIEGMTDFVTKPVDEQALESVLARHGVRLT